MPAPAHGRDRPTYRRSQLKAAPFGNWVVGGYIFLRRPVGRVGDDRGLLDASQGIAPPASWREPSDEAVSLKKCTNCNAATERPCGGRYLSMLAPHRFSAADVRPAHAQTILQHAPIAKRTSPMSIGTWILMSFSRLRVPGAVAQFLSDRSPGCDGCVALHG